jgi:hypothetical protein
VNIVPTPSRYSCGMSFGIDVSGETGLEQREILKISELNAS